MGTSPIGTFGGNPLYTIVRQYSSRAATTISQIPLFSNLASTESDKRFRISELEWECPHRCHSCDGWNRADC